MKWVGIWEFSILWPSSQSTSGKLIYILCDEQHRDCIIRILSTSFDCFIRVYWGYYASSVNLTDFWNPVKPPLIHTCMHELTHVHACTHTHIHTHTHTHNTHIHTHIIHTHIVRFCLSMYSYLLIYHALIILENLLTSYFT